MAFIFEVNLAGPIPTRIFRKPGGRAMLAYVGMESEYPLSYHIHVGLSAGGGGDEYYFKLIEVDAENGDEREYWDGREVGRIVTKDDRSKILQVVLRVTRLLIDREQPKCFYCCTHGDNMPPHALEKYELINQLFIECGYEVTLTNSNGGRHSWWVERIGENGCCAV